MVSVSKALHWDFGFEFRVWSLMLLSRELLVELRASPLALLLCQPTAVPWPPWTFAHRSPRVSFPASLLCWTGAAAEMPDAVPGYQPAYRW